MGHELRRKKYFDSMVDVNCIYSDFRSPVNEKDKDNNNYHHIG
jgi:hypothetical protein